MHRRTTARCCPLSILLLAFAGVTLAGVAADWTVEGDASEQQGAELGYAVAPAGDVNGDGYPDLLVGAPHHSGTVYREGGAFVYYGRPSGPDTTPAWQAGSSQQGALFGYAVAAAGDVNGDGYDDILIGAPAYKNEQTGAGGAFLYYGSADGVQAAPGWQFVSEASYPAALGIAVAGAGDVNGDGYDDLIVGAGSYEGSFYNEGAAFLFFGASTGVPPLPTWQVEGGQRGAQLGLAVAGAGDVNGDGYDDILVGAPHYNSVMDNEGLAVLYLGAAVGPASTPAWRLPGVQAEAALGRAVSAAGDVNGDGYDDILVAAPIYDGTAPDQGRVYLFRGGVTGPATEPAWEYSSGGELTYFGIALSGGGDYNRDGYDDVLVGANLYDDDQPNEGAALLFLGWQHGLSREPQWQATGDKADAEFGFAVAVAGDVNGDGYDDLLCGAPAYKRETVKVGRAFAYLGRQAATPVDPLVYVYLPFLRR